MAIYFALIFLLIFVTRTVVQLLLCSVGVAFLARAFGVAVPYLTTSHSVAAGSIVRFMEIGDARFYDVPSGAVIGALVLAAAILLPKYWKIELNRPSTAVGGVIGGSGEQVGPGMWIRTIRHIDPDSD